MQRSCGDPCSPRREDSNGYSNARVVGTGLGPYTVGMPKAAPKNKSAQNADRKTEGTIDVYRYTDYRLFLKDFYRDQKKAKAHFSYRQFAQKARVSASLFKDVEEGRRKLTEQTSAKYALAMGLNSRQSEYFLWMVRFVNATDSGRKANAFTRMGWFRAQSGVALLQPHQYEYFSRWHHCAIREMAGLDSFRDDPEWIATQLHPTIDASEVSKSIELLQALGLLVRDRRGRLRRKHPAMETDPDILALAVRQFHHQMIQLSGEALERFPVDQRQAGALTLCTSRAQVDRIKERLDSLRDEILAQVVDSTEAPEGVWQVNFQLFPLVLPGSSE